MSFSCEQHHSNPITILWNSELGREWPGLIEVWLDQKEPSVHGASAGQQKDDNV
jgi:hypothetical protein